MMLFQNSDLRRPRFFPSALLSTNHVHQDEWRSRSSTAQVFSLLFIISSKLISSSTFFRISSVIILLVHGM